jgi:hypothetical protein
MANERAAGVGNQLGDKPVKAELDIVVGYLNREVTPILRDIRRVLNGFIERPQVPMFESSPVTDLDFDPYGTRPPRDGVLSYSLTDGKLYVRRDGNSTHVAVVA